MKPFDNKTDEEIEAFLLAQHFICVRKLDDGEWIGLHRLAYTMSVCMGIEDISPFKYRWCFSDTDVAKDFYDNAVEYDEIPNEQQQAFLKGHRHTSTPRIVLYDELGYPRWR